MLIKSHIELCRLSSVTVTHWIVSLYHQKYDHKFYRNMMILFWGYIVHPPFLLHYELWGFFKQQLLLLTTVPTNTNWKAPTNNKGTVTTTNCTTATKSYLVAEGLRSLINEALAPNARMSACTLKAGLGAVCVSSTAVTDGEHWHLPPGVWPHQNLTLPRQKQSHSCLWYTCARNIMWSKQSELGSLVWNVKIIIIKNKGG